MKCAWLVDETQRSVTDRGQSRTCRDEMARDRVLDAICDLCRDVATLCPKLFQETGVGMTDLRRAYRARRKAEEFVRIEVHVPKREIELIRSRVKGISDSTVDAE